MAIMQSRVDFHSNWLLVVDAQQQVVAPRRMCVPDSADVLKYERKTSEA